jgi:hypothetical protein
MQNLEFTITGFIQKMAILENEKYNFKINWPIKELDHSIEVGHKVTIGSNAENIENPDIKKLLEELIN